MNSFKAYRDPLDGSVKPSPRERHVGCHAVARIAERADRLRAPGTNPFPRHRADLMHFDHGRAIPQIRFCLKKLLERLFAQTGHPTPLRTPLGQQMSQQPTDIKRPRGSGSDDAVTNYDWRYHQPISLEKPRGTPRSGNRRARPPAKLIVLFLQL